MGLGYTEEIVTKVAPARIFEAGAIDVHNLAPKIMPEMLAGIEILEGDGGPGTVLQVNHTPAVPIGSIKERVDRIDKEKFECQYTIFEGGPFGIKLESAVNTIKLVPQPDGGCIYRSTVVINTIPGVEFTEEDMQLLKAKDIGQFRALEGYLLANPTAYA